MRTALVSESVIDAPRKKRTREHRDRFVTAKWVQQLGERSSSRRRNRKSPRGESAFNLAGLAVSDGLPRGHRAFAERCVSDGWTKGTPRSRRYRFARTARIGRGSGGGKAP